MFKVGTLVWAQLRGYCYWPGQIVPHPEGKAKGGYYYVFFYGSHDYGWVPKSKVCIYAENRSKFLVKSRSFKFQIAVREVERIAKVKMGESEYFEEIGENEILRQQCEKMYPKINFRKCSIVLHRVKLDSHSASEVSRADSTMPTTEAVSVTDQVIRKKFQGDFPNIEFRSCSVILDRVKFGNHSKTDIETRLCEANSAGADDQVASEDHTSVDEEASLEDNVEFDDDAIESEAADNHITTESHIESEDDVMSLDEAAIREQLINDGDMYDDETAASDDSFLSEDSTSVDEIILPADCLISSDSSLFADDDDSLSSAEAAITAEHLNSAEDSMPTADTFITSKYLNSPEDSMSAAEVVSTSDFMACTSIPSTSHHVVNVSNADDYFSSDIIGIQSDYNLEEIEIEACLASTLQEYMLTAACPQASMTDLLNTAEAPSHSIEEIDICPDLSSSSSDCMEFELQAQFGYHMKNQPK